ncbi:WYL domain-containing protein [Salipaludibacillus keqinensis]|uniref:WYL domain-containing protein n=1 Tax=Salipaludibacillus keqinensis TaxID=2045207 RepID=A0A323TMK0_9BACI|nr:WYL domain-containing protein [Salipaludibacillus keqinensis]PYZ94877.1 WYL domain-containing protein [Salipaludibacillus keqinensis]
MPMNNRKRLLMVMNVLRTETDGDHPLTMSELKRIIEDASGEGLGATALRDDLKFLEQSDDFPVDTYLETNGLPKQYFYDSRLFNLNELRLLIDAVTSARFITKNETSSMIDKLHQLTSTHQSDQLTNHLKVDDLVKSDNQHIKYYIFHIHQAISASKAITFQYGRYNTAKKFVLSRDGTPYTINPYELIWNNDYYYLLGKNPGSGNLRHFRVDRMKNVRPSDETFFRDPSFDATDYLGKLFHMYSGKDEIIEIVFDNHLINVIIDRFGTNVHVTAYNETSFLLKTRATVSEGLLRWVLTWGSDAKVLKPNSLVEKMQSEAEKMRALYFEESGVNMDPFQ